MLGLEQKLVQPFALQCQLGFDQRDIVGNIMANVDVRKCDKLASRSLIARVTRLISNAAARRHVVEGQPDTAMRGRIPWQGAAVERDARPVDDLVARTIWYLSANVCFWRSCLMPRGGVQIGGVGCMATPRRGTLYLP